jgi:cytidylate kinase
MIGSEDVSGPIRDLAVSAIVSVVAAQPEVRSVLVSQQRQIAAAHPRLVTEGRDQGSVVFPDADLRFYLDAAVEVRAERRAAQLVASGRQVDRTQVIDDIRERDRLDSQRSEGPLIRPAGAVTIDTGAGSVEDIVDTMESIARPRLPQARFARPAKRQP